MIYRLVKIMEQFPAQTGKDSMTCGLGKEMIQVYILTVIYSGRFRKFFRRKNREYAHHKRVRSGQSESVLASKNSKCRGGKLEIRNVPIVPPPDGSILLDRGRESN